LFLERGPKPAGDDPLGKVLGQACIRPEVDVISANTDLGAHFSRE